MNPRERLRPCGPSLTGVVYPRSSSNQRPVGFFQLDSAALELKRHLEAPSHTKSLSGAENARQRLSVSARRWRHSPGSLASIQRQSVAMAVCKKTNQVIIINQAASLTNGDFTGSSDWAVDAVGVSWRSAPWWQSVEGPAQWARVETGQNSTCNDPSVQ